MERPDEAAHRPWHVLVVEDNPGDVRFIERAFAEVEPEVHLHVMADGEQALHFLRHEGEHAEAPRPALVLLDLNLPGMDGRDVLAVVKSDPHLKTIPILVLSGSRNEDDVRRAYDLHANGYIPKPLHFGAFRGIVANVSRFWLETARLPAA